METTILQDAPSTQETTAENTQAVAEPEATTSSDSEQATSQEDERAAVLTEAPESPEEPVEGEDQEEVVAGPALEETVEEVVEEAAPSPALEEGQEETPSPAPEAPVKEAVEEEVPPSPAAEQATEGVAEQAEPVAPPVTERPGDGAEHPEHPMEALLEEDLALKQFHRGQVVEGIVVAKGENELLIDIGAKSEGIVYKHEIPSHGDQSLESIQVGDEVLAYVLQPEGREGHVVLSLNRAQQERDWRRAAELQESQEVLEAKVADTNKGGVIIRFGQLRGFVPASQLERRGEADKDAAPDERFAFLKGESIKVKVLEVDRKRRRLIFSQRAAMRKVREEQKRRLLEEIQEGEVRRGRVSSITRFGAFVDLGGIDGLIHISELAWKHVKHPSEVVQVGDEVDVYVLNIDRERGRVGLSLRRLLPKPWETVLDNYAVGQVVEGVVTKVAPFGAFVRLEDGIEGLVHISELSDRRVGHPHEVVKEGDRVQARILRIEPEAKRMGLSIRQASEDAYVEYDWDVVEEEDKSETGTWEGLEEVAVSEEPAEVIGTSDEEVAGAPAEVAAALDEAVVEEPVEVAATLDEVVAEEPAEVTATLDEEVTEETPEVTATPDEEGEDAKEATE